MAEERKTVNEPVKTQEEGKKEKVVDFTARFTIIEQYSVEEAVAAIGRYLSKFKNLDEHFLALVGKAGAMQTEKLYFPIYRMEGKAEYLWVTGEGEKAVPHKELRQVKTSVHFLPSGLGRGENGEEKPLKAGEALAYQESGKKNSVKDCMKVLRTEAERTTPQKRSKITFTEEKYEISYLPVLKATLAFEGKTYTAYVNLVNGDCIAEYAVSKKLTAAVEKTVGVVKSRRGFIFVTFLYSLAFAVMSFMKFAQGVSELLLPSILVAGLALLELVLWAQCFAYKRAKMLKRGIEKGKYPKAKYALVLSVLSALVGVSVIVLFALQIL